MGSDRAPGAVGDSARATVRGAFVTGVAVVVPLMITLIVLTVAGQYVYTYLDLVSDGILGISRGTELTIPVGTFGGVTVNRERLIELVSPLVLFSLIFLVGLFVNTTRLGGIAIDYFDAGIAAIPGIGSVYESFRQMSDVMLAEETRNFRDVKLVEFPHEGAYTIGFVTTETPDSLREPTGHARMLTLFLPLAPNPVMGGHLVHIPEEKVMDVDMTVEEGVRAVVTSGVAVGRERTDAAGLSASELRELAVVEHADQQFDPGAGSPTVRRRGAVDANRAEEWDRQVAPRRSKTPTDVARRTRAQRADDADGAADPATDDGADPPSVPPDTAGSPTGNPDQGGREPDASDTPPAAAADRSPEEREGTDEPPASAAKRPPSDRERTDVPPARTSARRNSDTDENVDAAEAVDADETPEGEGTPTGDAPPAVSEDSADEEEPANREGPADSEDPTGSEASGDAR